MDLPRLTEEEQHALITALMHSFGRCTCGSIGGVVPMLCEGHRFLAETQVIGTERVEITRVARLLMTRREAHVFIAQEHGRPFQLEPEPMPERDVLPSDLFGPVEPTAPESPGSGDDNSVLPW